MCCRSFILSLALGLLSVGLGCLHVLGVEISEFCAQNNSTLADEDRVYSDWIEIFHEGPTPIDLEGYFLTDDVSDLSQWMFPAGVTLADGDYLIVFASGKNRAIAGEELHTNFKLSGGGESLFLVATNGTTIVSAYDPFPNQREDVSYGQRYVEYWVRSDRSSKFFVPSDGNLGLSWTAKGFDHSSWINVLGAVGYEVIGGSVALDGQRSSTNFTSQFNPAQMLPGGGNANFSVGATTSISQGNGIAIALNGNALTYETNANGGAHWLDGLHWKANVAGSWTFEVGVNVDGSPSHVVGSSAHGVQFWLGGGGNQEVLAVQSDGSSLGLSGEVIALEPVGSTANNLSEGVQRYRMAYDAGANRFSVWKNGDVLREHQPSVSSRTGGFFAVGDGQSSIHSGAVSFDYLRYDFSGAYVPVSAETAIFTNEVHADVQSDMHKESPAAYLRIPFYAAHAGAAYTDLDLRMQYDDGFVAYLNGVEIARRNAPGALAWNSTALTNRADSLALVEEVIDVSSFLNLVVAGDNVLAVHGLNASADAPRFLLAPELLATLATPEAVYFLPPTPGEQNGSGVQGLVADTQFSLKRGYYEMPISVLVTSATERATIRYTLDGSVPSETHGLIADGPITISNTVPLRAVAVQSDFAPSDVDTHTYIYLDDVLMQTGAGFPVPANPSVSDWDYEMDSTIVNDPRFNSLMTNALIELPAISVSLPREDLWGAGGIYANPEQFGVAWERAAAVEVLYASEPLENFQTDGGIRMQGAGSRARNLGKKSMRLAFRSMYGPGQLNHNLFGEDAPGSFDTIVLRGSYFDSWTVHTTSGSDGIGAEQCAAI